MGLFLGFHLQKYNSFESLKRGLFRSDLFVFNWLRSYFFGSDGNLPWFCWRAIFHFFTHPSVPTYSAGLCSWRGSFVTDSLYTTVMVVQQAMLPRSCVLIGFVSLTQNIFGGGSVSLNCPLVWVSVWMCVPTSRLEIHHASDQDKMVTNDEWTQTCYNYNDEPTIHDLIHVSLSCRCEGGGENPRGENGHKRVRVFLNFFITARLDGRNLECIETFSVFTALFRLTARLQAYFQGTQEGFDFCEYGAAVSLTVQRMTFKLKWSQRCVR